MIQISEKTAKALLEAVRRIDNPNKTLQEAYDHVTNRLLEGDRIKPYAQIENLRHIQGYALEALTGKTTETIPYLKEILKAVNCAIGGKLYVPTKTTYPPRSTIINGQQPVKHEE